MKKRALFTLLFLAMTFIGAQAFAQDEGDERVRFYDFENMLIDGEFRTPDLMQMEGRGQAQFDRLLNLQTSFLPKVRASSEEPTLRR